jgi:hypothetical protein
MTKIIAASLAILALAGCTSLARQHLEAQSRESCISDWGFRPGTPEFGQCYATLVATGQAQYDAEMAGLANSLAVFNQQQISRDPPPQTLNLNVQHH